MSPVIPDFKTDPLIHILVKSRDWVMIKIHSLTEWEIGLVDAVTSINSSELGYASRRGWGEGWEEGPLQPGKGVLGITLTC